MIRQVRAVGMWTGAGILLALAAGPVLAQGCGAGGCEGGGCASGGGSCGACATRPCPPPYKYHYEGPPCIIWKKGCPRPICDPCNLEHFGYYQTCWSPWPYPPDWSHCPTPPPGAVLPPPAIPPFTPRTRRYTPTDRDREPDSDAPPARRRSDPEKQEKGVPELEPPRKLENKRPIRFIE